MLVERKRPTFFCSTQINGIPEEYQIEKRMNL
jgi:hypothetical protein